MLGCWVLAISCLGIAVLHGEKRSLCRQIGSWEPVAGSTRVGVRCGGARSGAGCTTRKPAHPELVVASLEVRTDRRSNGRGHHRFGDRAILAAYGDSPTMSC